MSDLLVTEVLSLQEAASIDISVNDTLTKFYCNLNLVTILERCAEEKRRKYYQACQKKHKLFNTLLLSVIYIVARENLIFSKRPADRAPFFKFRTRGIRCCQSISFQLDWAEKLTLS